MLDRPTTARADPIADLASRTRGRALFSSVFEAGGPWSVRFVPKSASIKFGIVLEGQCWLQPDGLPARKLRTNDAFFLTDRRPYRLASDLALDTVEWDGSLSIGSAANVRIAGGRFQFDGTGTSRCFEQLLPAMFAAGGTEAAQVVRWVLERLRSESETDRPARVRMTALLSNVLFVQLLRTHVDDEPIRANLVAAIADPYVGDALRSIHLDPIRRWTVAQFAKDAGMSRSSFAAHFTRVVGIAPYAYALRCRMHVAERDLLGTDATVEAIAQKVGYESQSAFSAAFKRTTGLPPARYRATRSLVK